MRYACLIVPDLPVAVARRDDRSLDGRPIVVVGRPTQHDERVSACSSEARRAGIEPGLTMRQALSRCPEAVCLPWRAEAVATADDDLHRLLQDFSPAIEVVSPGHFHCDISGMPELTGLSPEAWAADLFDALRLGSGLSLRVACAELLFLAHVAATVPRLPGVEIHTAAARPRGVLGLVPGALQRDVLDALPAAALPVEPDIIARLYTLGLRRLGQVARLPLGALQAQFGPDGARMWRLARGREDLALRPEPDALVLAERMDLPAPAVSIAPLMHATRILLDRLIARPAVRGQAIRQVDWIATLEADGRMEHTVTFRTPTVDAVRMAAAIRARVERLPFTAPVVELRLRAAAVGREHAEQGLLWRSGPRNHGQLLDAAAQLAVRCGGPQIWRIVALEPHSRIPERQMGLVPLS